MSSPVSCDHIYSESLRLCRRQKYIKDLGKIVPLLESGGGLGRLVRRVPITSLSFSEYHRFYAPPTGRGKVLGDETNHQILLILRYTSSSLSPARELATVAFQWRTVETPSRIISPLLLLLLRLLIGVAFGYELM